MRLLLHVKRLLLVVHDLSPVHDRVLFVNDFCTRYEPRILTVTNTRICMGHKLGLVTKLIEI